MRRLSSCIGLCLRLLESLLVQCLKAYRRQHQCRETAFYTN